MKRRKFLRGALSGSAALIVGSRSQAFSFKPFSSRRSSLAVDSRIEVLLNEPIGKIAPEIYGHFAEHLGGVIYDGIWVGEDSKIPNVGGIRKSLIEALRRIKPSVVRWPGCCFADSYNWRDGVGPRSQRPRHTSFWQGAAEWAKDAPDGPWKYETNQFGTNEFNRFCRLIGAQPYLAANLRSGTARDFYEWVRRNRSVTETFADRFLEGLGAGISARHDGCDVVGGTGDSSDTCRHIQGDRRLAGFYSDRPVLPRSRRPCRAPLR